MSLGVNAFRPPGAAGATRLWVAADGESVIAKGTTPTGRASAWLSEAFGEGKAANRAAIRAFVAAVRQDYGDSAGDAVTQQLRARYEQGKPLSARRVEKVIATVQAQQAEANETRAAQFADLGSTQGRSMVETRFRQGLLSREQADALLAPNSEARAKLEADIQRAVLNAPKSFGSLVSLYDGLEAANKAVDKAVAGIQWDQTAAQLCDLGAHNRPTPSRAMVERLVASGHLTPEERDALLEPDGQARTKLEADIKQMLENTRGEAAPEERTWSLVERTAIGIAAPRVEEAAKRVTAELFTPGPNGEPGPRLMDSARRMLGDLGIEPSDDALAGMMTEQWRSRAAQSFANRVMRDGRDVADQPLDRHIALEMTRLASGAALESLKQGGAAAERALAGLFDDWRPDSPKVKLATELAAMLHPDADDPSLHAAANAFDAAALAACRERFDASPGAPREVYQALKSLGFPGDADRHARMSGDLQRESLQLFADLDEASVIAAARDGNQTATQSRTSAAEKLADIATLRIREIQRDNNCDEATAIDILSQSGNETDRRLLAQMDRVLANGGDNVTPGAWLETRKKLAAMRAQVASMARSGEYSGTDMQRLISAHLRDVSMNVFHGAVQSLQQELGPPPVPFTVFSIGSTARGEASPYSDLEFGILLPKGHPTEDESAYFDELCCRVRDQVAAVGENGSVYLPPATGFHFDENMSPFSTVPLSDGGKKSMLMGDADWLVSTLRPGRGAEQAMTALVNAEWLYGSDVSRDNAGRWNEPDESWRALQDFHATMSDGLKGKQGAGTLGQELGRITLDLGHDLVASELDANRRADPDVVDVKTLGRLPMLLVQGLAERHGLLRDQDGVAANNIDQRLTLLVENGRLTREDAEKIRNLQEKLSELRVRSHAVHGRQVDDVALKPEVAEQRGLLYDPALAGLIDDAQDLDHRLQIYLQNPRVRF